MKPANVLVFDHREEIYYPVITDFGYSRFETEDDSIEILARSQPWNAPELVIGRKCTLEDALKMDIFSFGMLCVWIMFEKYLAGLEPLPEAALKLTSDCLPEGPSADRSKLFLQNLKKENKIIPLTKLLVAEQDLSDEKKILMNLMFHMSLQSNPKDRASKLDVSFLK